MDNETERKKLDVTIQQLAGDEYYELSLGDVWAAIKRTRVKLLAWLLLFFLIGGSAGAGYVLLTRDESVTTIIQYSYDGVQNGRDPKGALLDVNVIKSSQIVEAALARLDYKDNEKVNSETIRQAIDIEGQVPQDVIDRLTVMTTIATNTSAITNLEKILDVSYYPSRFKISLDFKKLNLTSKEAQALLDAITESYREYFYDTYADVRMMGVAMKGTNYLDYDYAEALDVLTSQISSMESYVSGLRSRASDFRSVTTGFNFADILASLSIIRSTDISMLDALIYSYNLTKDKDLLLTFLNYRVEESERDLTVAIQTQDTINGQLKAYEKDTVLMLGNETREGVLGAGMSMTLASTEYDSLINQSISAATSVARLQSDIDKLQSRIQKAQGATTINPAQLAQRSAEAERRLDNISQKLDGWVDIIEQTAQEYFDTDEFKDVLSVLVPSQDAQKGLLMSIVKYGLIGAAGACGVVLMIYVIGVCFGLSNENRKRGQKAQAQAASEN